MRILFYLGSILLIPCVLLVALIARYQQRPAKPRFAFGFQPILNVKYWSEAVKQAGYESSSYVFGVYDINRREDFDVVVPGNGLNGIVAQLKLFVQLMLTREIFVFSFEGGPLGKLGALAAIEPYAFALAKKRTIVWPYGSDAYAYNRVEDMSLLSALQMSYPAMARKQDICNTRIHRWCKHADCLLAGFMVADGVGRFDLVLPNFLVINTEQWVLSQREQKADAMVVAHSPNHRGFKGTEFLIAAVEKLQSEGLAIELKLLEKVPNEEVKRVLNEEADLLVEQLIFTGHGLSAVEGMASGLPVICNLENPHYIQHHRRYSFFNECPLLSSTPETIEDTLRQLYHQPELRASLGRAGRAYAEKYQSLDFGAYMFEQITQKIWYGAPVELMHLFHPLSGAYPKETPAVTHPLVQNQLPNTKA